MEQRAHIIRISPLELTMRDVRESLADFAADFGFSANTPGTFEILSIERPAPLDIAPQRATVLQMREARFETRKPR